MAGLNGARAAPLAKGPWRGPMGKLPVGEDPGLKLTVEPSPCQVARNETVEPSPCLVLRKVLNCTYYNGL